MNRAPENNAYFGYEGKPLTEKLRHFLYFFPKDKPNINLYATVSPKALIIDRAYVEKKKQDCSNT